LRKSVIVSDVINWRHHICLRRHHLDLSSFMFSSKN